MCARGHQKGERRDLVGVDLRLKTAGTSLFPEGEMAANSLFYYGNNNGGEEFAIGLAL